VQALTALVGFARRYGVRKCFIERAGQQIVFIDQAREYLKKEGLQTLVDEVATGIKSKDDRILGLEEPFSRATVYVGKGHKFEEFRQQYASFPKSARKDILDAFSQAPGRWRKAGVSSRSAAQRQQAELASYFAKRGISPA
jgi:hypothetical protein